MQYLVMARPNGADAGQEVEICRVGSNPKAIVDALLKKTRRVRSSSGQNKVVKAYEHIYFKEAP